MTHSASQTARQLLQEQVDALTQLNELLRVEYDVLNTQRSEEVHTLSEKKQNLLLDLEVLNRSWQDFLRGQGAEFTLEGIAKTMETLEKMDSQQLPSLWQQLGELSRTCQQQNTINGAVVTLRQQVTKQALEILRGQSMGGGDVYDNKGGQKSAGGLGHTIAKA